MVIRLPSFIPCCKPTVQLKRRRNNCLKIHHILDVAIWTEKNLLETFAICTMATVHSLDERGYTFNGLSRLLPLHWCPSTSHPDFHVTTSKHARSIILHTSVAVKCDKMETDVQKLTALIGHNRIKPNDQPLFHLLFFYEIGSS